MRIVKWIAALIAGIIILNFGFIYLAPAKAMQTFLELERQRSGLARKEIDIENGLHFVYLEGGQGEALVLLHGFGADKDNFTRVARFLTPYYHVIIPDQIGFGESSHPSGADYTPEQQTRNLNSFIKALKLQTFHLGGSSMGGHIAMAYAAAHSAEVKSLWLLDTAGIWNAPQSDLSKTIADTGVNPLTAKDEKEFRTLYHFVMSDPPFVPGPILDVMAQKRISNFALESEIFPQLTRSSAEQTAKEIKIPTLIVWGEEDRAIHVGTADVLHKLIPQSKVIIMKGIGHLPMLERPSQTAQDFLDFHRSKTGI